MESLSRKNVLSCGDKWQPFALQNHWIRTEIFHCLLTCFYSFFYRFMTSKSGKLYLHTDIRIIVSRKADLDTATAHSALFRPIPTNHSPITSPPANQSEGNKPTNNKKDYLTNEGAGTSKLTNRAPNRVFGGCSEFDSERKVPEIGYDSQNGVSYELRSFTYAPENPKYSPR